MKTFSIITLLSLGVFFNANAQEKTHTPNARQAVQKSRMQQPQYMDLGTPSEVKAENAPKQVKATTTLKRVNYQVERPVAIDAPKRRSKRRTSHFANLASAEKK